MAFSSVASDSSLAEGAGADAVAVAVVVVLAGEGGAAVAPHEAGCAGWTSSRSHAERASPIQECHSLSWRIDSEENFPLPSRIPLSHPRATAIP